MSCVAREEDPFHLAGPAATLPQPGFVKLDQPAEVRVIVCGGRWEQTSGRRGHAGNLELRAGQLGQNALQLRHDVGAEDELRPVAKLARFRRCSF